MRNYPYHTKIIHVTLVNIEVLCVQGFIVNDYLYGSSVHLQPCSFTVTFIYRHDHNRHIHLQAHSFTGMIIRGTFIYRHVHSQACSFIGMIIKGTFIYRHVHLQSYSFTAIFIYVHVSLMKILLNYTLFFSNLVVIKGLCFPFS